MCLLEILYWARSVFWCSRWDTLLLCGTDPPISGSIAFLAFLTNGDSIPKPLGLPLTLPPIPTYYPRLSHLIPLPPRRQSWSWLRNTGLEFWFDSFNLSVDPLLLMIFGNRIVLLSLVPLNVGKSDDLLSSDVRWAAALRILGLLP